MTRCKKFIDINSFGGLFVAGVIIVIMSIIFNLLNSDYYDKFSNAIIYVTLFSLVLGVFLMHRNKKLNVKNILWLIFICSLFVKIGYVIKYPYTVNQHDLEGLDGNGHLGYIYRLAEFNGLPDTNEWQLYNPPLHYFICSIFFNINRLLGCSIDASFENLQMLTMFWSSGVSIISLKILRLLNFKGLPLILTYSVIAFHPMFTILGGSINNDVLAFFLVTVSLYYLIKYQYQLKKADLMLFSLFSGMSIMTKYSAFFAVFAMLIYLAAFSIKINMISLNGINLTLAPIIIFGFWFPVRNALLFGQNIVHYNKLNQYSLLYIPYSFLTRIFNLTEHELSTPFCNPYNDNNIALYSLKNSLFGEYTFNSIIVGFMLICLNLFFVIFTVISIAFFMKKRGKYEQKHCYIPILFIFLSQIAFYLFYNFIEPYGCSMDLRIVPVLIFCGIILFGFLLKYVHIRARTSKFYVVIYVILFLLITVFTLLSSIIFI